MSQELNSTFKFILMRHSESAHNLKKCQHKSEHKDSNSSYKESPQYMKTKFSKQLIDPQQIDTKFLNDGLRSIDITQIGLIITSPLNRCLTTVEYILAYFSNKNEQNRQMPEVIIEPLITSRISTAWSTGVELKQKKKRFPQFNFQQFPQQQTHWILNILNFQLVENYDQNDTSTQSILKFISEGNLQTYGNVMKRIRKFKWKLQNKYLELCKQKKILIISHNCLFKYLIGTGLNHKGKVHSEIEFQHCDPIFFTDKFILEQTYLKPDQNGVQIQTSNLNQQSIATNQHLIQS